MQKHKGGFKKNLNNGKKFIKKNNNKN